MRKRFAEAYILDSMTLQEGCQTIEVIVNGANTTVPSGLNLIELLRWLAIEPERVAVELNLEIVRQPQWASTQVTPGARLEIVQFVGGG